ncbi:MAG: hypothetical protein ABIL58_09950 [Pseudomonadota bacterium]
MTELSIEIYGSGLNLYIGIITPDQMIQLEKTCPRFFGYYWKKSLEKIWYTNRRAMRKIFGVAHWTQVIEADHHYRGPILADPQKSREFIDNARFTVDDAEVAVNLQKVDVRIKGVKPMPPARAQRVIVFHGEYYQGYTIYRANLAAPFDSSLLVFEFSDCGENGHILSRVRYDGRLMTQEETPADHGPLRLQFIVDPSPEGK